MIGYNGKILRVNLTDRSVKIEKPPESYYKAYIGGRGFIIHTLLNEVDKGVDPLGPQNKLIFAALGPATGHALMGSGRNSIGAKSPLTGAYGESEAGGFWGAELKRSGYDAVIVEGASQEPVFIRIDKGKAEICDAKGLWGLEIAPTVRKIQKDLGDDRIRVAAIGPAGERQVRYATIANDISHIAGRTGLGAVMGAKKLKAIAVRGNQPPKAADSEKLKALNTLMVKNFKEKSIFWKYGTGAAMASYETSGNLPVKNFAGGTFPGVKNIAPPTMFEKSYVEKMDGCFRCPLRCKRVAKLGGAHSVDSAYGGPEYETLGALGSNLLIDDLEALIRANELCNRYGIDTISAGVCISFAMECFENGILTENDTDGIDLRFGNAEAMLKMLEKISLREGFGDLLAEGTKRAAEKIQKGSEKFAMHIKGEEIPMHEPRYKQGMALHYSVHATGADHCTGIHDDAISKNLAGWERLGPAEQIPSTELNDRKARMLYQMGLWRHVGNYVGLCLFVPWSQKQILDVLEAITGQPMSDWKVMKAVERGITLARIFNLREGFTAGDDKLPERFSTSPTDGPLKGVSIDPEAHLAAKKSYYQMLGWDDSGIPIRGRLVELDIEWAARYL